LCGPFARRWWWVDRPSDVLRRAFSETCRRRIGPPPARLCFRDVDQERDLHISPAIDVDRLLYGEARRRRGHAHRPTGWAWTAVSAKLRRVDRRSVKRGNSRRSHAQLPEDSVGVQTNASQRHPGPDRQERLGSQVEQEDLNLLARALSVSWANQRSTARRDP